MANEDDSKILNVIQGKGLLSEAQIKDCQDAQKKMQEVGIKESIGEVAVRKGFLSREQLTAITRAASTKQPIEGFELLQKLGEGGMGAVYRARQLSMDRIVALKVLSPRLAKNTEFAERFLREARAVAKFSHPNIIKGFDVGANNNFYFFVMEFVDGQSVGSLLEKKGKLETYKALDLMIQTAKGLEHAHSKNIIHRDIKPDNILVTKDGVAKIADLGLARSTAENSSLTATGTAFGTPNYISPEQASGQKDLDARTDIYSLGVSFYHMVTGTVPFSGETAAVVMTKHINEPAESVRKRNNAVSEDLEYIITKMMAKGRNDRYQNCTELLKDLETVKLGNPLDKKSATDSDALPKASAPSKDSKPIPLVTSTDTPSKKDTDSNKAAVAKKEKEESSKKDTPARPDRRRAPKKGKSAKAYVIIALLLIGGLAGGAFYYFKNNERPNPTTVAKASPTPVSATAEAVKSQNKPQPKPLAEDSSNVSKEWDALLDRRQKSLENIAELDSLVNDLNNFIDNNEVALAKAKVDTRIGQYYAEYLALRRDAEVIQDAPAGERAEKYLESAEQFDKFYKKVKDGDVFLAAATEDFVPKLKGLAINSKNLAEEAQKQFDGLESRFNEARKNREYKAANNLLNSFPREYDTAPWKEKLAALRDAIKQEAETSYKASAEKKKKLLDNLDKASKEELEEAKSFFRGAKDWGFQEIGADAGKNLEDFETKIATFEQSKQSEGEKSYRNLLDVEIRQFAERGDYEGAVKLIRKTSEGLQPGETKDKINRLAHQLSSAINFLQDAAKQVANEQKPLAKKDGSAIGTVISSDVNGVKCGDRKYGWNEIAIAKLAELAANGDRRLTAKYNFACGLIEFYNAKLSKPSTDTLRRLQMLFAPNEKDPESIPELVADKAFYYAIIKEKLNNLSFQDAHILYFKALVSFNGANYEECKKSLTELTSSKFEAVVAANEFPSPKFQDIPVEAKDIKPVPVAEMVATCDRELVTLKERKNLGDAWKDFSGNVKNAANSDISSRVSAYKFNAKEQANLYYVAGQWNQAYSYYLKFIKDSPNDWEVKHGNVAYYMAKSQAQISYEKNKASIDRNLTLAISAAHACKDGGAAERFAKSREWMEKITEISDKLDEAKKKLTADPKDTQTLQDIMRFGSELERPLEERVAILWLIKTSPDNDQVVDGTWDWRLMDNFGRLRQWDQIVKKCLDMEKNRPASSYVTGGRVHIRMGEAYGYDNRWPEAARIYQETINKYKDTPQAVSGELHWRIAECFAHAKNALQSVVWYKKLYNEFPQFAQVANGETVWRIAETQRHLKRYDDAITHYGLLKQKYGGHWACKDRDKCDPPKLVDERIRACRPKPKK